MTSKGLVNEAISETRRVLIFLAEHGVEIPSTVLKDYEKTFASRFNEIEQSNLEFGSYYKNNLKKE